MERMIFMYCYYRDSMMWICGGEPRSLSSSAHSPLCQLHLPPSHRQVLVKSGKARRALHRPKAPAEKLARKPRSPWSLPPAPHRPPRPPRPVVHLLKLLSLLKRTMTWLGRIWMSPDPNWQFRIPRKSVSAKRWVL